MSAEIIDPFTFEVMRKLRGLGLTFEQAKEETAAIMEKLTLLNKPTIRLFVLNPINGLSTTMTLHKE